MVFFLYEKEQRRKVDSIIDTKLLACWMHGSGCGIWFSPVLSLSVHHLPSCLVLITQFIYFTTKSSFTKIGKY